MAQRNYRRPGPRLSDLKTPSTTELPEGLMFYCRACHQILDIKPKNLHFRSPIEGCRRADAANLSDDQKAYLECEVVYGTERSIKRFFKIPDAKFDQERREREDKAQRADKL